MWINYVCVCSSILSVCSPASFHGDWLQHSQWPYLEWMEVDRWMGGLITINSHSLIMVIHFVRGKSFMAEGTIYVYLSIYIYIWCKMPSLHVCMYVCVWTHQNVKIVHMLHMWPSYFFWLIWNNMLPLSALGGIKSIKSIKWIVVVFYLSCSFQFTIVNIQIHLLFCGAVSRLRH